MRSVGTTEPYIQSTSCVRFASFHANPVACVRGPDPHTTVSSPVRCSRARLAASRRSVLTRSLARFGISDGAITRQNHLPSAWRGRHELIDPRDVGHMTASDCSWQAGGPSTHERLGGAVDMLTHTVKHRKIFQSFLAKAINPMRLSELSVLKLVRIHPTRLPADPTHRLRRWSGPGMHGRSDRSTRIYFVDR